MGRRELGDYRGKFNRKRGIEAFLMLAQASQHSYD
jgi:hypothetical protein